MTQIGAERESGGMANTAAMPAAAVISMPTEGPTGPGAAHRGLSAAVSLVARREAISACRAVLAELRNVLFACTDKDLTVLAGELAEVRALAGAGVVAVTAEAEQRGIVAASQCASTAAWVADAAWHSRREASTIAKAAALLLEPDYAAIGEAVCAGDVDLTSAVACGRQYATLAPDLTDTAKPLVLEHLLDMACEHGPVGVRRLTDEILARYGAEGTFEEQCERRQRHIELSAGRHTQAGMWDYRLTVDGEGRAVLEAAIGPGSAPKPSGIDGCGDLASRAPSKASPEAAGGTPTGEAGSVTPRHTAAGSDMPGVSACSEGPGHQYGGGLTLTTRDTRSFGRRRGEALIDALRRSTAVMRHGQPAASPKAILMVTMDYRELAHRVETRRHWFGGRSGRPPGPPTESGRLFDTGSPGGAAVGQPGSEVPGAGVVLGGRGGGELLSPVTVRRIACDAGIIPVILGGAGEVLDQGRMERLFTPGQVRALWRRDRQCTFPDCDVPAAWCDAHHLVHWADGGRTDLSNAALLCPRHHTIVHRDHLAGHVIQHPHHPSDPPSNRQQGGRQRHEPPPDRHPGGPPGDGQRGGPPGGRQPEPSEAAPGEEQRGRSGTGPGEQRGEWSGTGPDERRREWSETGPGERRGAPPAPRSGEASGRAPEGSRERGEPPTVPEATPATDHQSRRDTRAAQNREALTSVTWDLRPGSYQPARKTPERAA